VQVAYLIPLHHLRCNSIHTSADAWTCL
jgi:hypothetical protein